MSAYEIPSAEIALHFWRKRSHEIDFGRGDDLPLCRYCDQPMDAETWARDEACPARRIQHG